MDGAGQSHAVPRRVRAVLFNRLNMGSFNLAASSSVNEFKSSHCAGALVGLPNHASERSVAKWAFQKYRSICPAVRDRFFGKNWSSSDQVQNRNGPAESH